MKDLFVWLFGLGAMAALFTIYQQKERKKLLLCKLTADICWVCHYALLGAWGGMIPNFVGIFRELVFLQRGKRPWAESKLWPMVFLMLNWVLGLRTFSSPINIIPIAASTCVTLSLWIKDPVKTKRITVPVCAAFLVYDLLVGSWIGVINESISLISIAIYFIRRNRHE